MRSLLRLPCELQSLLLAQQPLRPAVPTFFRYRSFHRHISLAASPTLTPSFLLSEASSSPAIFEDSTNEYATTPVSTLGFPPTPRAPQDALLNLLEGEKYVEADALLRDLLASSQPVEPHVRFARHALHLFSNDHASTWLEWWALAPSLPEVLVHGDVPWRTRLAEQAELGLYASAMLDTLSCTAGSAAMMQVLAAECLKQGHHRVVADHVLVLWAALGRVEEGEILWEMALASVQRQEALVEVPRAVGAGSRGVSEERTRQASLTRFQLDVMLKSDILLLKHRRSQMLRAYGTSGRWELVVGLVESSRSTLVRGRPLSVSKAVYLSLLSLLAQADKFELFDRLYACMRQSGGRITRARTLSLRTPYFSRALTAESDAGPSPQEAFTTYRYATFRSPLEEGPSSTAALDTLVQAIAAEDLAQAAGALTTCIRHESKPPLDVAASFISLARSQDRDDVVQSISELFDQHRQGGAWVRAYWETAVMLEHLRGMHDRLAVAVFARVFDRSVLPLAIRRAIDSRLAALTTPTPPSPVHPILADPHTVSVLVEALLAQQELDELEVDELYACLFTSFPTSGRPKSSTLLRPSIFLPFLHASLRLRQPPFAILSILSDMQERGIPLSKHHIATLLTSYAVSGPLDDLTYLFDLLQHEPLTTIPSAPLVTKLAELTIPEFVVDAGVYANVMRALVKRGELKEARIYQARMGEMPWEDMDGRLRRVLIHLGNLDGRGTLVGADAVAT
jgi:hypothetical protein